MAQVIKKLVKILIPDAVLKSLRPFYHGLVSRLAKIYFGDPSKDLVVIGVTGTNGKSTTVKLISSILNADGKKTGYISTVAWSWGGNENLNTFKMTTPSGWVLQKWMRQMVKNDCAFAVLEISSEGLAQNRHLGISFDVAVFTNLTPEHLESHGGFENYKKAKAKLFHALTQSKKHTAIVANADDEASPFYLSFSANKKITFGSLNEADFKAEEINSSPVGVSFKINQLDIKLQLKGKFDVYNALAAIATTSLFEVSLETAKLALEKIPVVPGRVEIIQTKPFTVVVDYAPEPYSLKALYETLENWPKQKLIHVLGSTGGGRDKARRKILGEMAGRTADLVIVTNEDPYEDDPQEIINEVAAGAFSEGKIAGETLFTDPDRRVGIAKALKLAKVGDLVLVTGKGAEQRMAVAGGYIPWDDRKVIKEELAKLSE